MHRQNQPGGLDLDVAQRSRSQSMSSDQPSLSGLSTLASPPPSVKPEPAYIAPSAAAQIVTSNQQNHTQDWFDENGTQPPSETALVSSASLVLINSFLDQLLYNFLLTAKSTSLASLRPAVSEVLKPRLAREAIAGADEELHEFLGGGDDEELSAFHNGQEPVGDCDVELVWKRTRLRCMVYIRLGDLEEEEEDMWVERENLEDVGGVHRRFSRDLGVVSPAVAIFLTSILEFIGEHALMVAGEATHARIVKSSNELAQSRLPPNGAAERFIVEEMDMEKVAFNTTLGRLWRTWRKRIRSPTSAGSRGLSREGSYQRTYSGPFSSSTSRQNSVGALEDAIVHSELARRHPVAEMLQQNDPASIPLPMTDNDVGEIEGSGYTTQKDDDVEGIPTAVTQGKKRPRSMLVFPSTFIDPPTPISARSLSPDPALQSTSATAASHARNRSRSLPVSEQTSDVPAEDFQPGFSRSTVPGETQESVIEQSRDNAGLAMRNFAGVTPSDVSAIPGNTVLARGAESETQLAELERTSTADTDTVKHGFDDEEEPKILKSTRISMEGAHSPVEIVQTRSRAVSSARSFKMSDTPHTKDQLQWQGSARSPTVGQRGGVGVHQPYDLPIHSDVLSSTSGLNSSSRSSSDVDEHAGYFASRSFLQGESDQPHASMDKGLADDEIATWGKRDSRLVLPSPLPPQSQRTSGTSTLSGKDLQPDGTLTAPITESPRLSLGNGSPALTPLREMTEDTHEPADQTSSFPPGSDERDCYSTPSDRAIIGYHQRSDPYSSAHAMHLSNGSRLSDLRNVIPALQCGLSTDKVAALRDSSPTFSSRGPIAPGARRSGSSGRDKRPINRSGSGASQASHTFNGLMDRQHGATNGPSLASRTSSEGSGSMTRGKHSQTVSRPEDKQRSFEKLIRSEETLQYTLTPQTVRDIEFPDSPRRGPQRSITADLADSNWITGATREDHARPTTGRSDVSKKASRSYPLSESSQPDPSDAVPVRAKPPVQPIGILPQPTNVRRGITTARDARIEEESVRDLADFFRSTGPENRVRSVPRNNPSRPTTASRPATAVNAGLNPTSNSPGLGPKKAGKLPTGSHAIKFLAKAESAALTRSGSRLQAREATVPYGGQSSDLIDFIRQGPPHERNDGTHRIPRTVAPFRTTMDSDEIHAMESVGDKDGITRSSVTSTQDDSMTKSLRSSSNSRTGLLDTTNRANAIAYNGKSGTPSNILTEEPPRPQRKQRRVRDPYAIDTDSDEDGDIAATSKPKRDEESLIDFLRNMPAPVSPPAEQSSFEDVQQPKGTKVSRKVSAPNLRNRFARNGLSSAKTSTARNNSAATTVRSSNIAAEPPQLPIFRPTATSSDLLTQTSRTPDPYKPTSPTYTTNVNRERNPPVRAPPRSNAAPQARSGRVDSERSKDLADFLKNSGPPLPTQPYTLSAPKEEGGFTRMFSRRKKSAGLVH
ncbi:MAG: hypothetical protein M1830_000156 [Pleopsidium flavum]|nr:MAG: hypothetical protein M1830_000156 [Pleopsidium flavum]